MLCGPKSENYPSGSQLHREIFSWRWRSTGLLRLSIWVVEGGRVIDLFAYLGSLALLWPEGIAKRED